MNVAVNFTLEKQIWKSVARTWPPHCAGLRREAAEAVLDGLVACVAPLPADEVGDEHDEHQPSQGATHGDGDQHAVLIQLALLHCRRLVIGGCPQMPPTPARYLRGALKARAFQAAARESSPECGDSPDPNMSLSMRKAWSHTRYMLREKVSVTRTCCSALHLYELPREASRAFSEVLVAWKANSARCGGGCVGTPGCLTGVPGMPANMWELTFGSRQCHVELDSL